MSASSSKASDGETSATIVSENRMVPGGASRISRPQNCEHHLECEQATRSESTIVIRRIRDRSGAATRLSHPCCDPPTHVSLHWFTLLSLTRSDDRAISSGDTNQSKQDEEASTTSSEEATDPMREGGDRSLLTATWWVGSRSDRGVLLGGIEQCAIGEPSHRASISRRRRSEGVEEERNEHRTGEEQRPVERTDVFRASSGPAGPAYGGHLVLLSHTGRLRG